MDASQAQRFNYRHHSASPCWRAHILLTRGVNKHEYASQTEAACTLAVPGPSSPSLQSTHTPKPIQRRVQTRKEPLVPRPDHYNHFTENYQQRAWLEATHGARTHPCSSVKDRRCTRVRKAAGGPGPRAETVHRVRHQSSSPLKVSCVPEGDLWLASVLRGRTESASKSAHVSWCLLTKPDGDSSLRWVRSL